MKYPHDQIWINGRDVRVQAIRDATTEGLDDFEKQTFSFIRAWLTGQETFELQTSGSTGTPKKIIIHRDQMIASARLTQKAIGLHENFTAFLCISPEYIGGKMMLVRALALGMKLVAVTPAANVFETLPSSMAIDFAALVPYQLYHVVRSKEARWLNLMKTIIIGGAALDAETSAMLDSFTCRCYATYGMTESISHVALQVLNGPGKSQEFNVLPGIIASQDDRGCLVIEAAYLSEKIITNDLISQPSANSFRWLGRWDNIMNSGGVKIIPEEIERKMQAVVDQTSRHNFMLCSAPDQKLGEKIILLLEGNELDATTIAKLKRELPKVLSRYELPKEVFVLKNFRYGPTGKLKRAETAMNIDKSVQNFTLKT